MKHILQTVHEKHLASYADYLHHEGYMLLSITTTPILGKLLCVFKGPAGTTPTPYSFYLEQYVKD